MQLQKDVELLVQEKKELEKMKIDMESSKKEQAAQLESKNKAIKSKEDALLKKDSEIKTQQNLIQTLKKENINKKQIALTQKMNDEIDEVRKAKMLENQIL